MSTDIKLRSIDTFFWSDPDVEEFDPSEKLLFLYFLTNDKVRLSGIYEIGMKKVSRETGFTVDVILSMIKKFEEKEKMFYIDNHVIVINYSKHQKYNPNMLKSVYNHLNSLSFELMTKIMNLNNPVLKNFFVQAGFTFEALNTFLEPVNSDDDKPDEGKKDIEIKVSGFRSGKTIQHTEANTKIGIYEINENADVHTENEQMYGEHTDSGPYDAVTKTARLFKDTDFFNNRKLFVTLFYCDDEYLKYDAEYYYETVKNWSSEKNKLSKNWIATALNFAIKDDKEGHPVYAKVSETVIHEFINKYLLLYFKDFEVIKDRFIISKMDELKHIHLEEA